MKFGIFYEHQLPRPVDRRLRVPAHPGRARADRARRQARHRATCGRSSTTSSRSTRTRARPRCSSRPRRSARRTSASVTASCRRRRRSTIRRASPSASRCSTSCRNGRVDFGTGESSSEAELGGFMIDPEQQARDVGRGLARRGALHDRDAVHRPLRRVRHDAAPQRRAQAASEAAPAAVGRVQSPRHDPPRRAEGHRRARVRVRRSRRSAALGRRLLQRRSTNEGVPIGDAVNAEHRVRHHLHVPRRRGRRRSRRGIEGANFFGYSLAHYYVFGRHRPARPTCGTSTRQRRAEHGYDPEAVAMAATNDSDRLGAKVVQDGFGGLRGAVGTPDQIRDYLRRYEECGVDQVIFCSQAGKNRHEHIMESLELFGQGSAPRVHGARRRSGRATRSSGSRRSIEAVMARKPADDHPPLPARRLRVPRDPAGDGRPFRQRRVPRDARPRSPSRPPPGRHRTRSTTLPHAAVNRYPRLCSSSSRISRASSTSSSPTLSGHRGGGRSARYARRRTPARRAEAGRRRVPRVARRRSQELADAQRAARGRDRPRDAGDTSKPRSTARSDS